MASAKDIKERSKNLREGDDESQVSKVFGFTRLPIVEEVPYWMVYGQTVFLKGSASLKRPDKAVYTDTGRKLVPPADMGIVDVVVMSGRQPWWDWSIEFTPGMVRVTPELLKLLDPSLKLNLPDNVEKLDKIIARPGDFTDDEIVAAVYHLIEKAEEEDEMRYVTRAQSFLDLVRQRHPPKAYERYNVGVMRTVEAQKEIDRTYRKLGFGEYTSRGW